MFVTGRLAILLVPKAVARMHVVVLTVIGPLYRVPAVALGVLPSVVYLMDAPGDVEVIATDCAVV